LAASSSARIDPEPELSSNAPAELLGQRRDDALAIGGRGALLARDRV
jgi:hypothetical protein